MRRAVKKTAGVCITMREKNGRQYVTRQIRDASGMVRKQSFESCVLKGVLEVSELAESRTAAGMMIFYFYDDDILFQ